MVLDITAGSEFLRIITMPNGATIAASGWVNQWDEEQVRQLVVDQHKAHFLFRSLCNRLLKRILNRFQISGIWLQAHFEIIEDRLLVGFGCGDFLELQIAQHDFVAPDRCQALNHVAYRPLAIFVGAVAGE